MSDTSRTGDSVLAERPVYSEDTLRLETEVIGIKPSRSKPEQGLVKVRITTLNQRMEPVQVLLANLVVPRRPVALHHTAHENCFIARSVNFPVEHVVVVEVATA